MKRTRLTSAISGLLAVPVLGLTLMGASSRTPHVLPQQRTVIVNCLGKQQVRPGTIVLA